jgi:peptide methionine sulfoxide reductase msrA/msrB
VQVYRRIDVDVYRKSTGQVSALHQLAGFRGISTFRADYHQQYLAKNPDGYCPDHSCGVSFKSAALAVGERV